MPKILIFHEKHGDRYFLVKDRIDILKAFYQVYMDRLQSGWYEDSSDIDMKSLESIEKVFSLMKERRFGEYEGFELVTPEKIKCPQDQPR